MEQLLVSAEQLNNSLADISVSGAGRTNPAMSLDLSSEDIANGNQKRDNRHVVTGNANNNDNNISSRGRKPPIFTTNMSSYNNAPSSSSSHSEVLVIGNVGKKRPPLHPSTVTSSSSPSTFASLSGSDGGYSHNNKSLNSNWSTTVGGGVEEWSRNLASKPSKIVRRSNSAQQLPMIPPVSRNNHINRNHIVMKQPRRLSEENMITFSPPDTPAPLPPGEGRAGESSLEEVRNNLTDLRTSLVLTAASPIPTIDTSVGSSDGTNTAPATSSSSSSRGRFSLVPHQSAGEPFWYPSPSVLRTLRSIENTSAATGSSVDTTVSGSGHFRIGSSGTIDDFRFNTSGNNSGGVVPDLRSIASGALVDIEIPASFAGSFASMNGSQTTLLSSPYRQAQRNGGSGSGAWVNSGVRRSFSADSLFGIGAKKIVTLQPQYPNGGGQGSDNHPHLSHHHGDCPAPLVVRPGSEHRGGVLLTSSSMSSATSTTDSPLTMKRTASLDQLRMLTSPYPMPTHSCFVSPKTAEMVRSLSIEERASLALSIDEPICRICWAGAESEECLQPCYCNTYVHQSCIQRWLSVAKITYCEVCRYQYKAIRKMKPVSQWRWWPNKNRHLAQLEATMILLGVVTPPLLCGIILCSQKIAEYVKMPDNAWKTAGLMTLVMVSVGTYLGAILYFCHKFTTVCRIWMNSNRTTVVTVVPLTPAQRRPKLDPCRVWSIS